MSKSRHLPTAQIEKRSQAVKRHAVGLRLNSRARTDTREVWVPDSGISRIGILAAERMAPLRRCSFVATVRSVPGRPGGRRREGGSLP